MNMPRPASQHPAFALLGLLAYLLLLSFFFAEVEIQIEGAAGWAANLPTWRIEKHWLLDWFWGGRPMTGYHAWVFSFMALVFHLPCVLMGRWSWAVEGRVLGALAVFWITEDGLWFVLNDAFGIARFSPQFVPWHKHWLLGVPTDYLVMGGLGLAAIVLSYRRKTPAAAKESAT
jgi:hypothetical protein